MKQVSIIGLGYIGLPTAAMFASHGVKVKGVDVVQEICDIINEGKIHIEEPYLEEIVKQSVLSGMFSASTIVEPSDNFIIAVPTPITREKKADLSYVVKAAESIYPVLEPGNLVILESTVSPRCTEDVLIPVLEQSGLRAGRDFYVAHCPERVLPGKIIHELEHNNKIIGGITEESAIKAKELYSAFVQGEMHLTDATTAELCKLMENTYRDVNIALANELAKICDKLGVNAWDVVKYANKHPRVNVHQPGPGVGGHCLAVDPWFIVEATPELARIIELSRKTNDGMPSYVAQKVAGLVPDRAKVVVLGCTYKPDVDDMRESPVVELIEMLEEKYHVEVVDPYIEKYDSNVYEVSNDADLIVLGVNHKQFKHINFDVLAKIVKTKKILDTRNLFDKHTVTQSGFQYILLGDGSSSNNAPVEEVVFEVAAAQV